MGDKLIQARDEGRIYAFDLYGDGDVPATGFTGAETFEVTLWAGDDRSPAWTSTTAAEWIEASPPEGQAPSFRLTVPDTALADVDPGTYRLRVRILGAVDGLPRTGFDGHLQVTGTAGTAAADPVYIAADDLLDAFPGLLDLEDVDSEQAAGIEPRAEARAWLDDQVAARAEARVEEQDRLGWSWGDADRAALEAIRAHLDAGRLLVDDAARRIGACYAVYRVLRGVVGKDGQNPYKAQALEFKAEAVRRLSGWKARLDTDDDGVYELVLG